MMPSPFELKAPYVPTGDQPEAIETLARGLVSGQRFQILEGVTGSGKTFTVANVLARYGRPTLVISHNKTLAAQLYAEFKALFPTHAVEYFVSYYDYYQPEAYIPSTDTYIEKDSAINEAIERLRLAATDALLHRNDVIIVASVSCIYGLGSPEDYREMTVHLERGQECPREVLLARLVDIQYARNDYESLPGTFRVRGDTVDVHPSYREDGLRIAYYGNRIERICRVNRLTGKVEAEMEQGGISPARHFVMPQDRVVKALGAIRGEMEERVREFVSQNKLIEAQRLRMRTEYDLEMMKEIGYCSGIENFSRHLSGRAPGARPSCLLDYFPKNFLTIIDESHVTLPQIRGMYNGDQARKLTLVEHGFRLPSALDNRPMHFDEFLEAAGPILFVSATPGHYEHAVGGTPVSQIIRPTGIVDPNVEVRPLKNQIDDLMEEVRICAARRERVLVTTLTKRTAEDLSAYLQEAGLKAKYLHSDIGAIDRVELLRGLRRADFDCLIGINLLREGLDLPEVSLVAILDADKEGFLRSASSLLQTAGRAARHVAGRVILYADTITDSMRSLLDVTRQRRARQTDYNLEHGITPRSIQKSIQASLAVQEKARATEQMVIRESGEDYDVQHAIAELEAEMLEAADALEYERAAVARDQIRELQRILPAPPAHSAPSSTHGGTARRKSRS